MFDDILHIGYLVDDLPKAVAWFERAFGGRNAGGTKMQDSRVVPGGGHNAFVRFGGVEVELMQPTDTSPLPKSTLVMHHVGYVVEDMESAVAKAKAKGLTFLANAPFTNPMGQQVLYFDPDTTNGVLFHLTKVPKAEKTARPAKGPWIDSIVHPGCLVPDLDIAVQWYIRNLGGVIVGGGPSRNGGRVAFVNCGRAQVELIERPDAKSMGPSHALDHVGYVTSDLDGDMPAYKALGLGYQTEAPAVNPIGQRLIYFDTASSMGARMHLTAIPD